MGVEIAVFIKPPNYKTESFPSPIKGRADWGDNQQSRGMDLTLRGKTALLTTMESPGHQASRPASFSGKGGHIPALDGIRGVAILLVMAHHLLRVPGPSIVARLINVVSNSGWAGVDLFFVLSGFLITGILWETRGQPNYFRNFYVRRGLRIFPLYYTYLLIYALLHMAWPENIGPATSAHEALCGNSGVGRPCGPSALCPEFGGLDDEVANGILGFNVIEAFQLRGEAFLDLSVGHCSGRVDAEIVAK